MQHLGAKCFTVLIPAPSVVHSFETAVRSIRRFPVSKSCGPGLASLEIWGMAAEAASAAVRAAAASGSSSSSSSSSVNSSDLQVALTGSQHPPLDCNSQTTSASLY